MGRTRQTEGGGGGASLYPEARFELVRNFCQANSREFTTKDLQTGEVLYKRTVWGGVVVVVVLGGVFVIKIGRFQNCTTCSFM